MLSGIAGLQRFAISFCILTSLRFELGARISSIKVSTRKRQRQYKSPYYDLLNLTRRIERFKTPEFAAATQTTGLGSHRSHTLLYMSPDTLDFETQAPLTCRPSGGTQIGRRRSFRWRMSDTRGADWLRAADCNRTMSARLDRVLGDIERIHAIPEPPEACVGSLGRWVRQSSSGDARGRYRLPRGAGSLLRASGQVLWVIELFPATPKPPEACAGLLG
ncbi:hypothetical protein GGG16DRAFT_104470 [Schizophyllum commune]